ncbi:hypothetical protein N7539_008269 [Penicillium diatomitis]|uniref:Uncharacterized protein n=1 Tax=Penicillium diatomitis TaxID=2819901 RepID=A0A9W9WTJ1_9EURO|nr:uncharacterized protein N7539_008269 [Penicillium diatomitis]KAJ5475203.1 hypothetical protein N7539_008269 [Penicillium diatomitis]
MKSGTRRTFGTAEISTAKFLASRLTFVDPSPARYRSTWAGIPVFDLGSTLSIDHFDQRGLAENPATEVSSSSGAKAGVMAWRR